MGAGAAAAIGPDLHSELEVTEDFPAAVWGILVKARWGGQRRDPWDDSSRPLVAEVTMGRMTATQRRLHAAGSWQSFAAD